MKVFITGITGTLGTEVTRILLEKKCKVIGYSRDEQKQRNFPYKNVTMYLGDVRDKDRLLEATRGVDVIFHFAALKCVDSLEANPEESVSTNILGTQNVLYSQRMNKIEKVCFTSTDKAVQPINVYGMCKSISERLVLRNHKNVVCRYGNVIGSRGSVVPMFKNTLEKENKVYITDNSMTRFWIRIEVAAKFVVHCAFAEYGLCIPPMKASSVNQIAFCIAKSMSIEDFDVEYTGIRPGEKIHENIDSNTNSLECDQYTDIEIMDLIR